VADLSIRLFLADHGLKGRCQRSADRDLSIRNFAWAPDGRKFVFRADAGKKCNYAARGYKIETGNVPCIYSLNLTTADVDGSHMTKINSKAGL
jgi:hypothetical protein